LKATISGLGLADDLEVFHAERIAKPGIAR
jgi:hypothetical protein